MKKLDVKKRKLELNKETLKRLEIKTGVRAGIVPVDTVANRASCNIWCAWY
jgi:hypothetical protein